LIDEKKRIGMEIFLFRDILNNEWRYSISFFFSLSLSLSLSLLGLYLFDQENLFCKLVNVF